MLPTHHPLLLVIAVDFALQLPLCCLWYRLACPPQPRRRNRRNKRPGYVRLSPNASGTANRTTGKTRTQTVTSTASRTPAYPAAPTHGPGEFPALGRIVSPTAFISGTAFSRGDHTTVAERLAEFEAKYPHMAARAASYRARNIGPAASHVAPYTWPST